MPTQDLTPREIATRIQGSVIVRRNDPYSLTDASIYELSTRQLGCILYGTLPKPPQVEGVAYVQRVVGQLPIDRQMMHEDRLRWVLHKLSGVTVGNIKQQRKGTSFGALRFVTVCESDVPKLQCFGRGLCCPNGLWIPRDGDDAAQITVLLKEDEFVKHELLTVEPPK